MLERRAAEVEISPPSRREDLARELALVGAAALVQLGGTALAAAHQPERGGLGLAGLSLLGAGVAALPFRRRWPLAVLTVTFATTLAYISLGYPRGPVFASLVVAFAHVVLEGHRRAAIVCLVLGFFGFSWLGHLLGREPAPTIGAMVGLAAWLVTLLSVLELARSRRARAREAARSQEEALLRRATEERLRIARELHDAVAHNMSLINLQAGVALHLLDARPEQARDALATIKSASKEALVELRSILGVLRQVDDGAPFAPTPGLGRLGDLVTGAAAAGVEVRLDVDEQLGELPRSVDLAAYRIIQESLTNVARHAHGAAAVVRVRAARGRVDLEVLDEGASAGASDPTRAGWTPAAELPGGGNGITGMRERASSVGGTLEAGPRPKRGFRVSASLPIGGTR